MTVRIGITAAADAVHVPIKLAPGSRNQVDPNGDLRMSVLEATGQPFQ